MGKVKIEIYCFLIADILTKVLQKCLLSGPHRNMYFLSKPLNLIDSHGNLKAKFIKHIQKSTGDKAETLQKCS